MKTIQEIQTNQGNGAYNPTTPYPKRPSRPPNNVIDENKSVKWNREEAERVTTEYKNACLTWRRENSEKESEMREDVRAAIAEEYKLNKAQAGILESMVWEAYHNSLSDYFGQIDETAEKVRKILDATS